LSFSLLHLTISWLVLALGLVTVRNKKAMTFTRFTVLRRSYNDLGV